MVTASPLDQAATLPVPLTPPELTPERWGDWDAATRSIAAMPLSHLPEQVSAYHHLTQHWVCAEVVQWLDGRDQPGLSPRGDHRTLADA